MTTPVLEPLPCPFVACNGREPYVEQSWGSKRWHVFCEVCAISGPGSATRDGAVTNWNARRTSAVPADQRPAREVAAEALAPFDRWVHHASVLRVVTDAIESDRAARPPRDARCLRPDCDKPGIPLTHPGWCKEHTPRFDEAAAPLPEKGPPRGPIAGCNRCGWKSEPQPDGTSAWIAADKHAREVHGDAPGAPEKEPPR